MIIERSVLYVGLLTRSTSQGKGAKPKCPTYGFEWFEGRKRREISNEKSNVRVWLIPLPRKLIMPLLKHLWLLLTQCDRNQIHWRHEINRCCPSKVISLFWCKTEKCSFFVSKTGVPIWVQCFFFQNYGKFFQIFSILGILKMYVLGKFSDIFPEIGDKSWKNEGKFVLQAKNTIFFACGALKYSF